MGTTKLPQLLLTSLPSVKLKPKLTQLSSTTPTTVYTPHTFPPTLLIHTPPLLLDTHTTRYTPLDTLTILQLSMSLESVKPKPTVMPLFTTELMDTTTDLHTPTTTVPHTLMEPTHTETFTEPGTEPLSRT